MQISPNSKKIAAAVFEKDGNFLIAQRGKKDSLYGKWEFPGGKLEGDETLHECLKREMFEEFSIHVDVGEYLCTSTFYLGEKLTDMVMFMVYSFSGEIKLNEHLQVKWVSCSDLRNYDYPAPDIPVIEALEKLVENR